MCPTCRARFRGTRTCSRCGADLALLMRLEARAWHLREASREALLGGRTDDAIRLAAAAQRVRWTERGSRLLEAAVRDLAHNLGRGRFGVIQERQ